LSYLSKIQLNRGSALQIVSNYYYSYNQSNSYPPVRSRAMVNTLVANRPWNSHKKTNTSINPYGSIWSSVALCCGGRTVRSSRDPSSGGMGTKLNKANKML